MERSPAPAGPAPDRLTTPIDLASVSRRPGPSGRRGEISISSRWLVTHVAWAWLASSSSSVLVSFACRYLHYYLHRSVRACVPYITRIMLT